MKNTFNKPIIPPDENERLKALRYYDVLSSLPDSYFHNLAQIVAKTFDTPIGLVSFVESEEVYYKGNSGMGNIKTVPRGVSLCSLAILDKDPTVFKQAEQEPCLLSNPLVAGDFGLRFYAGAPITTPEGFNIGVVCVVDKVERDFTDKDEEILSHFARVAMTEIVDRKQMLVESGG